MCKIRPRSFVEVPGPSSNSDSFQEEQEHVHMSIVEGDNIVTCPDGGYMEISDNEESNDDVDIEVSSESENNEIQEF